MASDPERDSISARISPACPADTQQLLTASWAHDLASLKKLLDGPGKASTQDPHTRETPLHAAIRSCGAAADADDADDKASVEAARGAVYELFLSGAIWNDVDDHDETPGCVAWRLGRNQLYDLCVEAGVRAEMLFGVLDGYEELESGPDDMEDVEEQEQHNDDDNEAPELIDVEKPAETLQGQEVSKETDIEEAEGDKEDVVPKLASSTSQHCDVTSEEYLRSGLTFSDRKLVDDAGNGVMMAWETDIMSRSVDALLPGREPGKRILNIGFGMGIIDGMFAETKPARHHIIEAHPEAQKQASSPESLFGPQWESSGPEPGAFKVHHGRWQEICPQLLESGEVYDAIYFDTFGEDYAQLRTFFTEYVVGLLDPDGVFGFFNGLGADRRICYDVYTKVAEMHLSDAGLDVDWKVIDVDLKGLEEAGKGEWEGVRRRYWTLDSE